MEITKSPWLAQLQRTRQLDRLEHDAATDVIVVGGGIAGIVSSYYILKNTNLRVHLLEANRIAHGATGHNAGQLATYMERPFFELAQEVGLRRAEEGKEAIESAWDLLDEIYREARLQTPLWTFTGWAGSRELEELVMRLKNRKYRETLGMPQQKVFVAKEADFVGLIPKQYSDLYALVPQADILALLETDNAEFTAALPARKGCMNSAMFTEELAGYLLAEFKERFVVSEETPVRRIVLKPHHALALSKTHMVRGQSVLLCTNGFEKFTIINEDGPNIDTSFHHSVVGVVGYMAGYLDELNLPPTAISFLPRRYAFAGSAAGSEPYFYLTRRPFENYGEKMNLICVGGPEISIEDTRGYGQSHQFPGEAQLDIDRFLHTVYKNAPEGRIEYRYRWHGLMGYTPSGVRLVGFEPCHKRLLYNLGCNGVGIMPSIYGGYRISLLLRGDKLEPSIFDPRDQRCELPRNKRIRNKALKALQKQAQAP